MSLDGFVAGPDGQLDWLFRSRGDDSAAWVLDTLSQAGMHVMGRRTFDEMAGHWPTSTDPMAAAMNDIPKALFTRQESFAPRVRAGTRGSADRAATGWTSPRVVRGDLAEQIQRLKQEPGNYVLAHGGARFARSLIRLGLVDEYRLLIHPVALGSGLPLFTDLTQSRELELVGVFTFRAGVVAHVYRAASASPS